MQSIHEDSVVDTSNKSTACQNNHNPLVKNRLQQVLNTWMRFNRSTASPGLVLPNSSKSVLVQVPTAVSDTKFQRARGPEVSHHEHLLGPREPQRARMHRLFLYGTVNDSGNHHRQCHDDCAVTCVTYRSYHTHFLQNLYVFLYLANIYGINRYK